MGTFYKKGVKLIAWFNPGEVEAFKRWIHLVSRCKTNLSKSPPLFMFQAFVMSNRNIKLGHIVFMIIDTFLKRTLRFSHIKSTTGTGHEIDHPCCGAVYMVAWLEFYPIGEHTSHIPWYRGTQSNPHICRCPQGPPLSGNGFFGRIAMYQSVSYRSTASEDDFWVGSHVQLCS